MSARDDLCQIIHRGIGLNFEYLAEEILAAGFHRHRIITTAEELDELRYRTVVKDRHGFIHQKFTNNWQEIGDFDSIAGSLSPMCDLPVTVIWEPGDDDE